MDSRLHADRLLAGIRCRGRRRGSRLRPHHAAGDPITAAGYCPGGTPPGSRGRARTHPLFRRRRPELAPGTGAHHPDAHQRMLYQPRARLGRRPRRYNPGDGRWRGNMARAAQRYRGPGADQPGTARGGPGGSATAAAGCGRRLPRRAGRAGGSAGGCVAGPRGCRTGPGGAALRLAADGYLVPGPGPGLGGWRLWRTADHYGRRPPLGQHADGRGQPGGTTPQYRDR